MPGVGALSSDRCLRPARFHRPAPRGRDIEGLLFGLGIGRSDGNVGSGTVAIAHSVASDAERPNGPRKRTGVPCTTPRSLVQPLNPSDKHWLGGRRCGVLEGTGRRIVVVAGVVTFDSVRRTASRRHLRVPNYSAETLKGVIYV